MSKSLMTHLYFGDPGGNFSLNLARILSESGADILEVGIPYTDPVCDGEIFQNACRRALANGTNPFSIFEGIRKLKKSGLKKSVYLTSYFAPVFKIGIRKFTGLAKDAGVRGLIIPDILLEEQAELQKYCRQFGLSLIQFATVYSTKDRIKIIADASTDFIYTIALPGVTGDDQSDLKKLYTLIKNIKSVTDKKILVGFGIDSPSKARRIINLGADGLIIGSAIAKIYEKQIGSPDKSLPEIAAFVKALKKSTI